MEVSHDVGLDKLRVAAQWLQSALGKELPSALLRAGDYPQ